MAALRYRLWAEPLALRAGLGRLMVDLSHLGMAPQARIDAEIVLAEVLNNIAEHAYAGAGGPIRLALIASPGDDVACLIADCGRPMPQTAAPTPPPRGPVNGAAIAEGGYGLALVAALAPGGRYRRLVGRNWLRLTLAMGAVSSA
jgi:serine/threonine-protein kinase RsbW